MDGVQLPQVKSHFEEAVYFLPLSSQKFPVLILLTSEGWKAESTLEPTSGSPKLQVKFLEGPCIGGFLAYIVQPF